MSSYNNNNRSKNYKNTKGNDKLNYKVINKRIKSCTIGISVGSLALLGVSLTGIDYFNSLKKDNTQVKQAEEVNRNKVIQNKKPIKIEANELIEDYTNVITITDRKKIADEYYNEFLEITGEVDEVKVSKLNGNSIKIKNSEPQDFYSDIMKVQFCFDEDYDLESLDIDKGDEITITGYCKGTYVSDIQIIDCDIKQINDEIIP